MSITRCGLRTNKSLVHSGGVFSKLCTCYLAYDGLASATEDLINEWTEQARGGLQRPAEGLLGTEKDGMVSQFGKTLP